MFDLKWSKYYKSISHKVLLLLPNPNTMLRGCPQTCWPEYNGWGCRVTTLSSRSYSPNYHIYESICYFVGYLLLLIGSCLSRSYISDKFFSFLNFPSCNLLPYSLLGYLLTRIESRGLLQYSYHITKSCWTKANRAICQVCLFQGTNAWKTAWVSAANAPNKLYVLPK